VDRASQEVRPVVRLTARLQILPTGHLTPGEAAEWATFVQGLEEFSAVGLVAPEESRGMFDRREQVAIRGRAQREDVYLLPIDDLDGKRAS
jgi:hypothetical protein